LGIISLAHAPVHVTDFPVVNVHVDELSSARTWQHKLCATYSANVNTNNLFQSKYTTVSVLLDLEISESKNISWKPECVLSFNMGWWILVRLISANPC
jgi:hypothetical protein